MNERVIKEHLGSKWALAVLSLVCLNGLILLAAGQDLFSGIKAWRALFGMGMIVFCLLMMNLFYIRLHRRATELLQHKSNTTNQPGN